MIPLSIQIRQILTKVMLPILFLLTLLIMLIGQTQPRLVEILRLKIADILAPAYALIEKPVGDLQASLVNLKGLSHINKENRQLKAENEKLKRWYYVAIGLSEENALLKSQLHWVPDPTPTFVTARAVVDVSGVYGKALLVALGPNHPVHSGEIALDAVGFIGRVTEVGERSARILLINDNSSRIPVSLESSHAQAIMAGDNSLTPRLIFYPEDNHPLEGERVVTGDQIGVLPAGIPIGSVHYVQPGKPVIIPYAALNRLTIIRIFDYGRSALSAPEAPIRVPSLKKEKFRNRNNISLFGHG